MERNYMKNHYENIKNSNLLDLFPIEDFRLVREEHRKIPCGISEIPITIDMKRTFSKMLSFKLPWDCELHGFVKCKKKLFEKTGYDNTVKITISDWDEKFTIIFEDEKGHEEPVYSVEKAEMKTLLENCIKPEKLF